jgi:hypothetical protein
VQIDGRAITCIRGDKQNPRTEGYLWQQAQRLTWYGNHDDRLTTRCGGARTVLTNRLAERPR